MTASAAPLPEPTAAYITTPGMDPIPVSPDEVLSEINSSPSELWLAVRLPAGQVGQDQRRRATDNGSGGSFGTAVSRDMAVAKRYLVVEFDRPVRDGESYWRNGYQSWSFTGLARAGEAIERPGIDMAAMSHFSHLEPPVKGPILAESESILALEDLVVATLDGRRAPACFFGTPTALAVSFDISRIGESEGGSAASSKERVFSTRPSSSLGSDILDVVALTTTELDRRRSLIDRLLGASALLKGARASAPLYSGWCTWYQYFSSISEAELLKNLSLAEKHLHFLDVFQLDDGYQRAIGDWLETNDRFPSGVAGIARKIEEAGFIPGIWIAPFVATTDSSVYKGHSDWFLKLPNGSPVPAMLNFAWGGNGLAYALDCTHPEVLEWLERLGAGVREAGYRYIKIDFCYAASMHGLSATPRGRAEALVLGVQALRRGLGEDVFLLGCGIPLWPVVGLLDGARIGPDVAPTFLPQQRVHGLTDSLPALANAWRNTIARAPMHRKFWVNDPDCVMLRKTQTSLDPSIAEEWGKLTAALGQMVIVSDDLSLYGTSEFAFVRELVNTARANDVPAGTPSRAPDFLHLASYGRSLEQNEQSI